MSDVGNTVSENSPKLLKMRRVSLFSLGQTLDEDDIHILHSNDSMYWCALIMGNLRASVIFKRQCYYLSYGNQFSYLENEFVYHLLKGSFI